MREINNLEEKLMVFFTEEQKRFCKWIREFAVNELSSGALERAKMDYITEEVIKKLANYGILEMGNTPFAKRPTDYVTLGITMEEICKIDFTAMIVFLTQVAIYNFAEWMCDELREDILSSTSAGKRILCVANTEPDCGSDAVAIKTNAIKRGDSYIINGEKTSISVGMQADGAFITAKTDPEAGVKGITLFYVPLNLPGVSRFKFNDMGNISAGRASLIFEEVQIPIDFRIGNEGEGFTKVMRTFDASRVLVALSAIGLAEACIIEAIEYVKRRQAFGNSLGKFEGVAFKLAEHATIIEAARLLCYKALKLRDEALPHSKEAAMAKWYGPKCAVDVIHDIILLLGHKGYNESYPFEQRWRDSISCLIGDGTSEIMKLIIARELLGRQFYLLI